MDAERLALKGIGSALDSQRAMRLLELKARVQRAEYEVDPPTVALALLRHAVSQRRWWNPRMFRAMPPAFSATAGGPAMTLPIHVSGTTGSPPSRGRQTHSS